MSRQLAGAACKFLSHYDMIFLTLMLIKYLEKKDDDQLQVACTLWKMKVFQRPCAVFESQNLPQAASFLNFSHYVRYFVIRVLNIIVNTFESIV